MSEPKQPLIERLRRRLGAFGVAAVIAVLALAAAGAAYRWSFTVGIADLQAKSQHQLDLYASHLEHEVSKYAYVPLMLGLEPTVLTLLTQSDAALAQQVNRLLERWNSRIDTQVIYVLDAHGTVIAASNWQQPDSFVSQDLSYRPYFQDALQGRPGHFYGIGTTSGEPGYYLSYGVGDPDQRLGVAVAKVNLDRLERTWSNWPAPILITDEEGVVILASVPAWKFTALAPLSPEKQVEFQRNRRYNRRELPPLPLRWGERLAENAQWVEWTGQRADGPVGDETGFIARTQPLANSPWRLTVLAGARSVRQLALSHAALAGVVGAVIPLLLLLADERRRYIEERLAAREALQRANAELEDRVAAQTAELSAAVTRLEAEVAERRRTEKTLRETQDGLVQAGKLAVIGQLATGITHELNQPLAALRTLSDNTVKFLERGNLVTVRSNLGAISQLTERMGAITAQLKRFARKSSGQEQRAVIGKAFANVLALLDQRIRKEAVEIRCDLPPDELAARCDQNRLEQVLVNLIGNALDAMRGQDCRRLDLSGTRRENTVLISVRDCGPGLPVQVREHLFEPFFTTKEADAGLGLGLTIPADIVRDCGGALQGDNDPRGGAVFRLTLPSAEEDTGHA